MRSVQPGGSAKEHGAYSTTSVGVVGDGRPKPLAYARARVLFAAMYEAAHHPNRASRALI